ncbi:DUF5047 domain-containing protein [Streptomyces sp. NBC_00335]|uniref:DUF5047 domain-containing protein n=1 Tax=unclassified Streptomyces TaxID=2593676 RepID=UPI0022512A6D|nr:MULTISPECIES: DUF5047 domain-containing protein [unclassified Streptomyces]MCX5407519.1 DUF5047 domain-containing protein [Streptomyces sp. NBC_00086]
MWAVSARWDPALRGAARPAARATVYPPQAAPFEARLLSWSVTSDRTAQVRRTCQVTLAPETPRGLTGVTTLGGYLQLDVGLDYLDGSQELIPQGYFRIDADDTQRPDGGIAIQGYGRERVIIDDAFLTPRTASNSSALDLIESLLLESVPDAVVVRRTARDAPVARTTWEKDRWGAIDGGDASLARSLGVEVWADGRGRYVISDVPTLSDPVVWTVDSGAGGVLVTAAASTSVDRVYNVVVAVGDASNGSAPIGPVIVQDLGATSPTRVGGPFGRRVRHYSSPLLGTVGQADTAARSLLANSLGLSKGMSFTAVPNAALEPGDVVLASADQPELHILDKISLSSSGPMSCETRSTKADDGSS